MIIPAWAADYVGLPYLEKGRTRAGVDCWGFVRLILAEVAGQSLPDYSDAYTRPGDQTSVAAAVESGLRDGWQQVDRPQALDLLILRIAGRPWHCAAMLNAAMFIHVPPPGRDGRQQLSCIERLDSPQWARRIGGFWRISQAAPAEIFRSKVQA